MTAKMPPSRGWLRIALDEYACQREHGRRVRGLPGSARLTFSWSIRLVNIGGSRPCPEATSSTSGLPLYRRARHGFWCFSPPRVRPIS